MTQKAIFLLSLFMALTLTACRGAAPGAEKADKRLAVVATTSIIGDVAANVGGDAIDLTVLIPAGSDPHSFEPSPRQIAALADADIIFVNGFDLEQTLQPSLASAATPERIVAVSDGVEPLLFAGDGDDADESGQRYDPHTWMDPNNVIIWTQNMERALTQADPAHSQLYHQRGQAYREQLQELDEWIASRITPLLPLKVVTDHKIFGYFARRYGIEQVGAIIPSYSSMSQPSAQEIAQLEDVIKEMGVKAILLGDTVNPNLAKQVAADTGVRLVHIYTGSLSRADGPAPTYIDFMHYDVDAIMAAAQPQ